MKEISYCNLNNGLGRQDYRKNVLANIEIFKKIFQRHPEKLRGIFDFPQDLNYQLMEHISKFAGVPLSTVLGMNLADEALNSITDGWFGCTSIGKGHQIGQTLDLYTVDLAVVREGDTLSLTMPPYMTLMGMGRHLAFCTNHLFSTVCEGNTPVSYMRRELLRLESLKDAINYLNSIKRMTSVNFLLSDGSQVVDLEVTPQEVKVWPAKDGVCAHTNHLVEPNFFEDNRCTRLSRAMELLSKGEELKTILDDFDIFVPVTSSPGEDIGFGSIVQVIMDVKEKTLRYRGPEMGDYRIATII